MRPEPTLEAARWPDGSVRLIDSGFPIDISMSDQDGGTRFSEVRIALAKMPDDENYVLYVFDKGTDGPRLQFASYVNELSQMHPTGRTLVLADGGLAQYMPAAKCGCGSRLRSFRPWEGRVVTTRKPSLPWVASEVSA